MPTGRSRNIYARGEGIVDQAVRLPYEAQKNDEVAADAEKWFLGLYGVPEKMRYVGVNSCDLVVGKAHLDVKSTPVLDGRLIRHKDTEKDTHWCTAYVLIVGKPGTWEVRGWAWGFSLQKSWDTTLPKPAWALRQSALRQGTDALMASTFGLVRGQPAVLTPQECYACGKKHDKELLCRPMTEYLWAIVKGGNRDSKAWRWARARLGLDEGR